MRLIELTNRVKSPSTDRSRKFINDVVMESELLQNLNNFSIGSTEGHYRPADGSQSLAARAIAGAYDPSDLTPAELITAFLKIHGFILHYDETYETDHSLGIGLEMAAWLEQELEDRSIDTSEAIEGLIINGPGTGNNFKGLATILDGSTDIPGLGITGVIDAAQGSDVSFDLSDADNYALFEELFEIWRSELKGVDLIILNRKFGARMKTVARKNNAFSTALNVYGERLEMIDGIPMIRVNDSVITNTEPDNTDGTALENTTSMYLVKNRVGHWDIKSNSGLAIWEPGELQEEKMSRALKFEIRGRNQIRRKTSVRRVRNIKL